MRQTQAVRIALVLIPFVLMTESIRAGAPRPEKYHRKVHNVALPEGDDDMSNPTIPGPAAIQLETSLGGAAPAEKDRATAGGSEPLESEAASRLLSRLPQPEASELPIDAVTAQEKIGATTLHPPKSGDWEELPVPDVVQKPGAGPVAIKVRPLEVLRSQPEGDVAIVQQVSVTFSAPMVALGSDENREQNLEKFPIRISPAVPGAKGRWLSPRTLIVKTGDRLPMATRYTLTIPAGTKSAQGATLSQDYIKHFRTAAPQLVSSNPGQNAREVEAFRPFVLQFNQRVDPRKLLETLSLKGGGRRIDLKLASEETGRRLLGSWFYKDASDAGRILVLESTAPLAYDTDYSLHIPAGTTLAEGPIGFKAPVDVKFRTISPFKITSFSHEDKLLPLIQTDYEKARPGTPLRVTFNHQIDVSKFKPEWITIDPKPREGSVNIKASGAMVTVSGFLKPKTTYKIGVSEKIEDIYGQRLADDSAFKVTIHPSTPQLITPPSEVTLLSARAESIFPVLMMNMERVEVEIRAVEPWEFLAFNDWRMSLYKRDAVPTDPPGKVVWSKVFESKEEEKVELERISLEPAFQGGFGTALVIVKTPSRNSSEPVPILEKRFFWIHKPEILGELTSHGTEHTVMVSASRDGLPVADAELVLQPSGKKVRTDAFGFARFNDLFDPSHVLRELNRTTYPWMEIRKGAAKDALFLDRMSWRFTSAREIHQKVRVWASSDRSLYRPGEQVHVHGWVRSLDEDLDSVPELVRKGKGDWFLKDSRGVELARGEFNPSAESGRFSFDLKLPTGANLGEAQLDLRMVGSTETVNLAIQEFRKPEFEANITSERPEYQLGEEAVFTLSSKLFGGGSPVGLPVEWSVNAMPVPFHSAAWPEYRFGQGSNDKASQFQKKEDAKVETDSKGEVSYRVRLEESARSSPWLVRVFARMQDLNRQSRQFQAQATFIGRDRALGLEVSQSSLRAGVSPRLSLVVVDPTSGKHPAISGEKVTLELWKTPNRYWFRGDLTADHEGSSERVETLDLQSGSTPLSIAFKTQLKVGSYEIRGLMQDSKGRSVETYSDFTVWGHGDWRVTSDSKGSLKLKWKEGVGPQGSEVGKKLVLQVESAMDQAQGTAMIRSVARGELRRFELKDGRAELTIIPDAKDNTNIRVEIELVDPDDGREEKEAINVGISRPERRLSLEVKPSEFRPLPGSTVQVKILARDHQGKSAGDADIWVFAVDDALLSLRAHDPGTPENQFWSRNTPSSGEIDRRNELSEFDIDSILSTLESLNQPRLAFNTAAPAPGEMPDMEIGKSSRGRGEGTAMRKDKGAGREEEDSSPIAVRKDFRALAFYEARLKSNSQGQVEFEAKLPDSTTRYTIFAVALDLKGRSGAKRETLQTGLPFYLRPSLPRFLNLGDQAELSVLVQNQTDESREAQIVARAWGIELSGDRARKINIPGGETREIRFPVRVNRVGKALIQVGLLDPKSKVTDAVQQGFPLYLPATIEAYAQSGSLTDRAVVQPLEYPSDAEPGIGGLNITLSSTRLQSLKDVWLSLEQYPFECNEQLASKLLAVAAMKPVLKAFLGKKSADEVESKLASYISLLKNRIKDDGSFDFWGKSDVGNPFITVHVAHGLVRAQKAGIPVPKDLLDRNLGRLRTIRSWMESLKWDLATQDSLEAYALRVRQLHGESVEGPALEIYQRAKGRSGVAGQADLELLGHLLPVLQKGRNDAVIEEILRTVNNRIEETDGRAHLITHHSDGARVLLFSNRRAEAVMLEGLVESRPELDFLPKLVEGVLGTRIRGRWSASTQESVFTLLAVGRYFEVLEKAEPKFKARVWLDKSLKGERKFEGRELVNAQVKVPLSALEGAGKKHLILEKQGPGRMYYRIGLSFAPSGMDFAPEDRGFEVSRIYEALDDPKDVRIDGNGIWHIKAGARVRIRTRLFSQVQRDHVALVESFPAGFEPEDIVEPWRRGWYCLWWGTWYNHSQLRDQRAEAFAEYLSPGEHEIVTVVRATGIGKFTAPPARAEEMYNPDVFGRSRSEKVWIEE